MTGPGRHQAAAYGVGASSGSSPRFRSRGEGGESGDRAGGGMGGPARVPVGVGVKGRPAGPAWRSGGLLGHGPMGQGGLCFFFPFFIYLLFCFILVTFYLSFCKIYT